MLLDQVRLQTWVRCFSILMCLPNRTVDMKGVKTDAIKTSGHTAVLSCCADGTQLSPMLIFKRKMYPKEAIPPGILVQAHEEG